MYTGDFRPNTGQQLSQYEWLDGILSTNGQKGRQQMNWEEVTNGHRPSPTCIFTDFHRVKHGV